MVQFLPDGTTRTFEDMTDWARVDAMTEEIEANAANDPDNPPMTVEELDRMQRVPDPKAIRPRLQLSQGEFAERFHVLLGTLYQLRLIGCGSVVRGRGAKGVTEPGALWALRSGAGQRGPSVQPKLVLLLHPENPAAIVLCLVHQASSG